MRNSPQMKGAPSLHSPFARYECTVDKKTYLDDLSCYGLACLVLLSVQGLQPVRADSRQRDETSEAIDIQNQAALIH